MVVLETIYIFISGLLTAIGILWSVEVILGSRQSKRRLSGPEIKNVTPHPDLDITVLIPAHNEEGGIEHTIQSIQSDLQEFDRILVVADNCSDQTAMQARNSGADVVERHNSELRGKGYALAFGIEHLASNNPPSAIVIIDADCEIVPGSFKQLRDSLARYQRPIQALYLIVRPDDETTGIRTKIAEFAMRIKNDCRARGLQCLGAPVHLSGSGMAFLWEHLQGRSLATGHLAEDLDLGLRLAHDGLGARFEGEAKIISAFPKRTESLASQRKRWIHGHIASITGIVPKAIMTGLAKGRFGVVALALDATIPPFLFFAAMICLWLLASFSLALFGLISVSVLSVPLLISALIASALAFAWYCIGRNLIGLSELTGIIPFAFESIKEVLMGLFKREKNWVRTNRDENDA